MRKSDDRMLNYLYRRRTNHRNDIILLLFLLLLSSVFSLVVKSAQKVEDRSSLVGRYVVVSTLL